MHLWVSLFLCLLHAVVTVLANLICSDNQVYVKISKKCRLGAEKESYRIVNNGIPALVSPVFADFEHITTESCIDSSINEQYVLEMEDSTGNTWTSGSWIEVSGLYGTIVYKGYMSADGRELHPISFYMPIKKGSTWSLFVGSVEGSWTDVSYSETNWGKIHLGSIARSSGETQYLRKEFSGLEGMAAYEARFNYRYGIVAFINGVEIFRDNMPSGHAKYNTPAIGSYAFVDYHSVIRSAAEVTNAKSILAVELHWLSTSPQTTVDFDSFVAIYASSEENTPCYAFPYPSALSGSSEIKASPNWTINDKIYQYGVSSSSPAVVSISFEDKVFANINGLRILPSISVNNAPRDYVLSGSVSPSSSYVPIITASQRSYNINTASIKYSHHNSGMYHDLKLTVTATDSSSLSFNEVTPMICNIGSPRSIAFEKESYSIYVNQDVVIRPIVDELTACEIRPDLPDGLTLDTKTCIISGIAQSDIDSTIYTVFSTVEGVNYQGAFDLQINTCEGSLLELRRVYKQNGYTESYSIVDEATQTVVYSVLYNSGQINYSDSRVQKCLTGSKYRLNMQGSLNYWDPYSFIFMYIVLSGDEKEMAGRYNIDDYLSIPQTYLFNVLYTITPTQEWYYIMGSVPTDWMSSDTTGLSQAHFNTFPLSTNRVQIYKKTFNVASITDSAGFTISLRYKYGCVIALNGHETFRNRITGPVSTSTTVAEQYNSIIFRTITLPIKTIAIGNEPSVNYLQQGTNYVSIAIVAMSDIQTTSYFDCVLRILGRSEVSRSFMHSNNKYGITGTSSYPFIKYHGYDISSSSCSSNWLIMTFLEDRKEWISSIVMQNSYLENTKNIKKFTLQARSSSTDSWITLKVVDNLHWSYPAQERKIWLENNNAYNEYRWENISTGSTTDCNWLINRIDMFMDATTIEPPALSYSPETKIFKKIEMAELYPSSNLYGDFAVTPNLPAGITIDSASGMISGTATSTTETTIYKVTARKYTGGMVEASFKLTVKECSGVESLITMTVRTDSFPGQSSYKMYKGKGTQGVVEASVDYFPRRNALYYADFCLPHSIYTMEVSDSAADGWLSPAGYKFSVDIGMMPFDMGQVPSATSGPIKVVSMFSSLLPFQVEKSDWKVYTGVDEIPGGWRDTNFDDSLWRTVKANEIGSCDAITAYIRHLVVIPDLADYKVLNVRIKYSGGVVAYFNGRRIARFNLEDSFGPASLGLIQHDSNIFSKFHCILSVTGANVGNNIISFEIHRAAGSVSSSFVLFDATGVFGVDECSVLLDTYSTITGTKPGSGEFADFFDISPFTVAYIPNNIGSYIEWTVENLEGTLFNSFALHTPDARSSFGFSVLGVTSGTEKKEPILEMTNQSLNRMARNTWSAPIGYAAFRTLRYVIDDPADNIVYINSLFLQYCVPKGTVCPADGEYPSVSNGEMSVSACNYGYSGYTYRVCTGSTLGPKSEEKCVLRVPEKLVYEMKYQFIRDIAVETNAPSYSYIITKFHMAIGTALPAGLEIDEKTGKIFGTPVEAKSLRAYTIVGENASGEVTAVFNLIVKIGSCYKDGLFSTTDVGKVLVIECMMKGDYYGSMKRACKLGKHDGEWDKVKGICFPKSLLWVIIAVVIVILIVVLFVVNKIRTKKDTTAPKGRKSTVGSIKSLERKGSTGVIKV